MISVGLILARFVLFGVFAVAGVTKLMDQQQTRLAVRGFGIPARFAATIAGALPLVELAIAGSLLSTVPVSFAALAAIALLLVFIGAITRMVAQGERLECRCFGQLSAAPVGVQTIVRNVVLIAVAGVLVAGSLSGRDLSWTALFRSTSASAWGIAALWIVLGLLGWLIFNLMRQQGQLLFRIDELEQRLATEPQPAVATARFGADFDLPSVHGERVTLRALRAGNRPTLLVFADPNCGPCNDLMPEVAAWQGEYAERLTIAVIGSGRIEENRAKSDSYGLQRVLVQPGTDVSDAYGVAGTPSAVLVATDGSIAGNHAAGADEIRALVASTMGVAHAPVAAAGVGDEAPDFALSDINGSSVQLRSYLTARTLVVFWNPTCGFCVQMLDRLREWERAKPIGAPDLVVVSAGGIEQNAEMGLNSTVLADPRNTVAPAYGVNGTPTGLIVNADGRIATEVAIGADEIFDLARNLLAPGNRVAS